MEKRYYVYVLSSWSRSIYVGVTGNLLRRMLQHKQRLLSGFAKRYRIHRLVCFEAFGEVNDAIRREKQIKSWRREKKVALVKAVNPAWRDLAASWRSGGAQGAQRRDPSSRTPTRTGSRGSG